MTEKKIKVSTVLNVALGATVVVAGIVILDLVVKNNARLTMIGVANEVVEELGGTTQLIVDKYAAVVAGK